jgi:Ankyrin repeats (many copies)
MDQPDVRDFDGPEELEAFRRAVAQPESLVARFEAAVAAVIDGDEVTLRRLLNEHPELIRARSMRRHHATLLNYVGANGVERQQTPANAVRIATMLLDAGAEIDAVADLYGGTTTLGLVATSVYPEMAGVQEELLTLLLQRGARLDIAVASDYTRGHVVNACLANGRPKAAAFLASRGAHVDLSGAAGLGRLDLVASFFDDDGKPKPGVTRAELEDALRWASDYGHTAVIERLLGHGIEVDTRLAREHYTALHAAAYAGHPETVAFLLARGAPLDVRDQRYDSTPLGWAIYAWATADADARKEPLYQVVALLTAAGARLDEVWLAALNRGMPIVEKIRTDARMRDALGPQAP